MTTSNTPSNFQIARAAVARLKTVAAGDKPELILWLEKTLGLKFKGPFSDGREWDAALKVKKPADQLLALGKMGSAFSKKGYNKVSQNIRSAISFSIDKTTDLGIDLSEDGIEITVFFEED